MRRSRSSYRARSSARRRTARKAPASDGARRCPSLVRFHAERAQRSRVVGNRPYLDTACARAGDPRGDLDRLVQVARLEHVVAAELLLRLGEWPVGRRHLAVAYAHRRCGSGWLQPIAIDEMPARPDVRGEARIFVVMPFGIGVGHLFHHLLGTNQAEESHRALPTISAVGPSGRTSTAPPTRSVGMRSAMAIA